MSFDHCWAIVKPLIAQNDLRFLSDTLDSSLDAFHRALLVFAADQVLFSEVSSESATSPSEQLLIGVTQLEAATPSVLWRVEQLATATVEALERKSILVAALCCRALIELALSAMKDSDAIEQRWQAIRNDQRSCLAELQKDTSIVRLQLHHFYYGTRYYDDGDTRAATKKQNVLTALDKFDKSHPDLSVKTLYHLLSEACHPNVESALQNWSPTRVRNDHLLQGELTRTPALLGPIPEAVSVSLVLGISMAMHACSEFAWVSTDAQLRLSSYLPRKFVRVLPPKTVGMDCPCGSGRQYSACTHEAADFTF